MSETLLHRVAHTPLRDIVRFRITARLDRTSLLEGSGLPAEVRTTISTVARRTRLSRLEKADVTRELIAHFTDALETGTPAEASIERFGDLKAASKLIRRSKLRQRSLLWWAWRRTWQITAATLLLAVGLYSILTVRFVTGSPSVTRDYLAEINAPALAVPESARAWPVYREAHLLATEPSRELVDAGWFSPESLADPATERLARTYLDDNAQTIALLHDASTKRAFGVVLSHEGDVDLGGAPEGIGNPLFDESLMAVFLPQLGIMRSHCQLVATSAIIGARDGDADRVMQDLSALRAIGEHAGDPPFLISDLVSLAILHLYVQTVGDLLASHPSLFSDAQLVELGHTVAGSVRPDTLRFDWKTERMMFDDLVQRVYTDDGTGDGRLVLEGLRNLVHLSSAAGESVDLAPGTLALGPVAGVVGAGRADLVRLADRMYAHALQASELPLWEWHVDQFISPPDELDPIQRIRYQPVMLFVPQIESASFSRERVLQHRDAVLAAIAIELYQRRHGELPPTLESLRPGLLPTLPLDRFDGHPLRYAIVDGRPYLYSVGVDRRDDGGRPTERAPSYDVVRSALRGATAPAGDWILWPRPLDSN